MQKPCYIDSTHENPYLGQSGIIGRPTETIVATVTDNTALDNASEEF